MEHTMTRVALAATAGVLTMACAHAPTPATTPPGPPVATAPPEVAAEAFEDATAVFARRDAEGAWDGEACHETLAAFERANQALGGRDARAVYMAGLVASRCGNESGARDLYSRALELDESLCEARVALGLMALDRGRSDEARSAFARAVREDGRCASGYVNLAILQSRHPSGREDALANLRRALAVRADYLPALDQMARIYLAASDERPELLDLAEVVCRQAQLVDAEWAPLYNTWALIDVARGDVTAAVAKLARAMALDPAFFEAHMNFGQLTLSQRAYEDAAGAFARARELRPSSYDAAIGLGVARRGLAQPAEAERLYRAAMELDDARPEAYFDLAVLYQEHRDGSVAELEQAERFLEQFVERARGETRFAETVQDVLRWCDDARRGRRAATCRPGRAQVVHQSLVLQGARAEGDRPAWTR